MWQAEDTERISPHYQSKKVNYVDNPLHGGRREEGGLNSYRSEKVLPIPLEERSPSLLSRRSVEKLWKQVRVDQVILQEAQAREAMIISDERAKKYLERNPQSFAKRVEANIRLNSLVRNPNFASMEEEDLYNLNRVKEYLHNKKS